MKVKQQQAEVDHKEEILALLQVLKCSSSSQYSQDITLGFSFSENSLTLVSEITGCTPLPVA